MKVEWKGLNKTLVSLAENITSESNCLAMWGEEKLPDCLKKQKNETKQQEMFEKKSI